MRLFDDRYSFVSRAFLQSALALEYKVYAESGEDAALLARLHAWDARAGLNETQLEAGFIQAFFVETWGYATTGAGVDHTLVPQLAVPSEGAADLGLGWFRGGADARDAQVLCEFKDIKSKLDTKQNRKNRNQTPVEQCLSYLRGARRGILGAQPTEPWWGLVTDMNEFRLYWWDRGQAEYLRFVIKSRRDLFEPYDLLSESEEAQFDRFLFVTLFQRDFLLSVAGKPPLLRLIERQWVKQQQLEGEFYARYKAVREHMYNAIVAANPGVASPGDLLRLTQKLLDRFIFAFYCEDMGGRMLFPPNLLRDHMKQRSVEAFYNPNRDDLWDSFRALFSQMNTGGAFGPHELPHINGGLFAPDPAIESLSIPNHVFAATGQGRNDASLDSDTRTLLHLSARYNFASRGEAKHSISLYTLGRIFEQSITELEYRVGELEGRETIAKVNKRKRDGVYYTPEWVVEYLVEQTMGPWFEEARAASGYPAEGEPTRAAVEAYILRLRGIRVVDPACGSGAFLIAAFRRLLQERMSAERALSALMSGAAAPPNETALIADILANNLYGVDINASAVEIAKLALWLHTARAETPLSMLDRTIRCGNSVVGYDFWTGREEDAALRERVNAFDWREAFPEVWSNGRDGFDIVLGNPPYVKLQNMTRVYPEIVAYLQADRGADTYRSAQTGNFDLYLVFIEKGLRLLGAGGRMAYIAPSLWAVNKYGEGLRAYVRGARQLERWIDFKSFQVFDEAVTYTALQFFTRAPQDAVKIALAPDGRAQDVDWARPDLATPYAAIPEEGEWLMATGAERALIERLWRDCRRLDDPALTDDIFQGVKTGADPIYKLRRRARGLFVCDAGNVGPVEVEIEDDLMHPIISGPEAKRYIEPETDFYLLFPYRDGGQLIPPGEMQRLYPKAWAYLSRWKPELAGRDNGELNDQHWYRFSRSQSLERAGVSKLFAAGTVPHLRLSYDEAGAFFLTGGRVDGIIPARANDAWYLLGVLNGTVADLVFRRIGRQKQGGWFEANKQFIAPLPIPDASPVDRADIAERARSLQRRWTHRRDLIRAAEERLSVLGRARHPARWLWPDLPSLPEMTNQAPASLRNKTERRAWAEARLDEMEAQACGRLQAALDRGDLDARYADGELKLFAHGAVALSRIYLDPAIGQLVEAYWRWLLLTHSLKDAKSFAGELRRPPADASNAAAQQFIERVDALAEEIAAIDAEEAEMNEALYALYELTPEERQLVEGDAAGSRR